VFKRKELELKGAQMKATTARNELAARQALGAKLRAAEERRARAEAAAAKARPKLLEAEAAAQGADGGTRSEPGSGAQSGSSAKP